MVPRERARSNRATTAGAPDAAIAAAAATTGVEWPEGMVALFRAINGEVRNKAQLIPNYQLLSLDEVLEDWQMLQDIKARMREDNGAGDGDNDYGDPLVPDDDELPEERFLRKVQAAEADSDEPQLAFSTDDGESREEIVGGAEVRVDSPDADWGVYGTAETLDEGSFDRELEDFRASLEHDTAVDYGPRHPETPEGQAGSVTENWIEPQFIPFASWDNDILAVDLRPGEHHGCVIAWEPVDRTLGMRWTSLEHFFTDLLVSLETSGIFIYSRPEVTADGELEWEMDN